MLFKAGALLLRLASGRRLAARSGALCDADVLVLIAALSRLAKLTRSVDACPLDPSQRARWPSVIPNRPIASSASYSCLGAAWFGPAALL